MTMQERLTAYLDYRQLTAKDFERICGLGNGTAASLSENVRSTTLSRISKGCPDLNIDWLCNGKGEMLKENVRISNSMNGIVSGSNNSNVNTSCENQSDVFSKALDEIAAQRQMAERMLKLVEDTTRKLLDTIPDKQQ